MFIRILYRSSRYHGIWLLIYRMCWFLFCYFCIWFWTWACGNRLQTWFFFYFLILAWPRICVKLIKRPGYCRHTSTLFWVIVDPEWGRHRRVRSSPIIITGTHLESDDGSPRAPVCVPLHTPERAGRPRCLPNDAFRGCAGHPRIYTSDKSWRITPREKRERKPNTNTSLLNTTRRASSIFWMASVVFSPIIHSSLKVRWEAIACWLLLKYIRVNMRNSSTVPYKYASYIFFFLIPWFFLGEIAKPRLQNILLGGISSSILSVIFTD